MENGNYFIFFYFSLKFFSFRLTPPLTISSEEINVAADIIIKVIKNAEKMMMNPERERASVVLNFPMMKSESKIFLNFKF